MTKIILLVIAFLVFPPVAKTTSEVYHEEIFPKIEVNNLVTNGDFSDGAIGWLSVDIVTLTVSNGIYSFISTAQNGSVYRLLNNIGDNVYLIIARFKSSSNQVQLRIGTLVNQYHSGSGNYEILKGSFLYSAKGMGVSVRDDRLSDWTQVDVDYMMVFNLTASHGVTATSGIAHDNAVADIDNLIATNSYFDNSTIDLPPNYNVDLSRLGSQIIDGIGKDVIKFVRNSACIVSGVAKTVTLGVIKVPDFCPTIIPPLPWIHQNYMKLLEWLKG